MDTEKLISRVVVVNSREGFLGSDISVSLAES